MKNVDNLYFKNASKHLALQLLLSEDWMFTDAPKLREEHFRFYQSTVVCEYTRTVACELVKVVFEMTKWR
jgi:hypothetical protein